VGCPNAPIGIIPGKHLLSNFLVAYPLDRVFMPGYLFMFTHSTARPHNNIGIGRLLDEWKKVVAMHKKMLGRLSSLSQEELDSY